MNAGDAGFVVKIEVLFAEMLSARTKDFVDGTIEFLNFAVWLNDENFLGVEKNGLGLFVMRRKWSSGKGVHPGRGIACGDRSAGGQAQNSERARNNGETPTASFVRQRNPVAARLVVRHWISPIERNCARSDTGFWEPG